MSAIQVRQGDTVWGLLKQAGLGNAAIAGKLGQIAELNGTTVRGLDKLQPGQALELPPDLVERLPADRRLAAFQGGAGRPGDAASRPVGGGAQALMLAPDAVLAAATKTALKAFDGYVLTQEEANKDGVHVQLAAKDFGDLTIDVDIALPKDGYGGTVTITNGMSGFAGMAALDARDVKGSVLAAKATYDLVHEYANDNITVTTTDMPERPVGTDPRFFVSVEEKDGEDKAGDRSFTWHMSTVRIADDKTGKVYAGPSNEAEIVEMRACFPKEAEQDWDLEGTYKPVGGVGPYASFITGESEYMGGAHPDSIVLYETIDARTGKQIELADLIGAEAANALIAKAFEAANKLAPDAGTYLDLPEAAAETAKKSFQVFSEGDTAMVAIGIPGYGAARGTGLEIALPLPASKELSEKLGLEA